MKKFPIAAMNGYTTGEALQFSKHTLKAYSRADIPELKLLEPFENFRIAIEALEEVFQESPTEPTSVDVAEMDKRRMELIRGMRLYLNSRLTVKDTEMVNKAQSVLNILKQNCTDIQYGSVAHRTERIHAFIRDINSKPGLSSSMEAMTLQDEFNELIDVNKSVFDRMDEKALTKKEPLRIQEKRKAAKEAYDILIERTKAFALVADDKSAYETILNEIDIHIERFNNSAKIRKSLKRKTGTKDDVVPETPVML